MSGLIDGIYERIIRVRNDFYDSGLLRTHWLDVPVISVGNVTVGGTGKTPTVILLAEIVKELGKRPGIILRGYGSKRSRESDETLLFRRRAENAIVVANSKRVIAGKIAIEKGADILIADDAFQHRRLGRDLDICLVDATFPFGGGRVLPVGRLREPIDSLKRADLIMITRVNQIDSSQLDELSGKLRGIVDDIPILQSQHKAKQLTDVKGNKRQLDSIEDKRVFLFASIGNPKSFEKTIIQLGANVVGTRYFPDHYLFKSVDLRKIKRQAEDAQAELIVCTEKDIVKLDESMLADCEISVESLLSLEIEIEILNGGKEILRKRTELLLRNFSRDILEQICTNK